MMIKKRAYLTVVLTMVSVLMLLSSGVWAYSDDETNKMKIDKDLFDEFYKLMCDNFTNSKLEGTIKQTVNGAYMESKYILYSKDLDYKRIDVTSYGDKFSHVTTPDKVWYYYEKSNYVIYYKNKKNVARFNSKVYFDSVKDDGKITKSVADGQTTYKLIDYNYNIKQTFVFDSSTKKLQLQLVEPEAGDKIETTYKGWEKCEMSKEIFNFPARAASKCLDQSMRGPSQGRREMGMYKAFNKIYR